MVRRRSRHATGIPLRHPLTAVPRSSSRGRLRGPRVTSAPPRTRPTPFYQRSPHGTPSAPARVSPHVIEPPPPQGTAGSDTLLPSPVGWGPRRAGTCEIPSVHLGSFPRRGGSGPTPFYQRSPHPVSGDGAGPRDVPSVIRLAARMGPSPTPFYQVSHNDATGRADISLELAGFGHSDFHHLARPPSPTPFYRPPSDGGTSARFLGV